MLDVVRLGEIHSRFSSLGGLWQVQAEETSEQRMKLSASGFVEHVPWETRLEEVTFGEDFNAPSVHRTP